MQGVCKVSGGCPEDVKCGTVWRMAKKMSDHFFLLKQIMGPKIVWNQKIFDTKYFGHTIFLTQPFWTQLFWDASLAINFYGLNLFGPNIFVFIILLDS